MQDGAIKSDSLYVLYIPAINSNSYSAATFLNPWTLEWSRVAGAATHRPPAIVGFSLT